MEPQSSPGLPPEPDVHLPRTCVYSERQRRSCPKCGARLVQRYASYLVATRNRGVAADNFVLGSDFGWFCPGCPTVVVESPRMRALLSQGMPAWDVAEEFALLGLVDFDAIPADRRHAELGTDDNPVPLVRFRVDRPPPRHQRKKKGGKTRRR